MKKVFVGMSGGVDSSVSAALLKREGYSVTGVFIQVWQPDWIKCNWKEERLEAMRVAAHLDIPFITLNLEQEYKQGVIDYMISEYRAGRTPNPDVMCNREVKFGAFLKWANNYGADYIATGHYAQIGKSDCYRMFCGKDSNKDQTYFLWTLGQEDLKHVLFPVGHLEKPEVRKLARKFGLPNAEKKDSQGLCFIGKVDVKEFLAHYIKSEEGAVLDEAGNAIGTHPGAMFFTIGERHGFNIINKGPNDKPYYVIHKDIEKNTVTVSNKTDCEPSSMTPNIAHITKVNWISRIPPVGQKILARSRYRAPLYSGSIIATREKQQGIVLDFKFDVPQETLTPGQSLVFYSDDKSTALFKKAPNECLGGGILV